MTDTPKPEPTCEWDVHMTDGKVRRVAADEYKITDGVLIFLARSGLCADIFGAGFWVSVHRVRREK